MKPLTIAYSDAYLRWKLGEGHPTNPVRAQIATRILQEMDLKGRVPGGISMVDPVPSPVHRQYVISLLSQVHDRDYVLRVLDGSCTEWAGRNLVLGDTAMTMFNGTVKLAGMIAKSDFAPGVYFNPQGAKHHAQYAHSSGFCVFNDMAWAAQYFTGQGKRVAYMDWDAHHGDGVENLTRHDPDVLTASIHQHGSGFYPGTGGANDENNHVYNWPLRVGAGDRGLSAAMRQAIEQLNRFKPDVLLLACGADGLEDDPLSSLGYTHRGLHGAARWLGYFAAARELPVLIGGAGGYRPLDHTPRSWATTVAVIQHQMERARDLAGTVLADGLYMACGMR